MQHDEVMRHFRVRPFQHLSIRMLSGMEYLVRTPECTITRRWAAFPVEPDLIDTVALEYIESIKPVGQGGRRNGNGRKPR